MAEENPTDNKSLKGVLDDLKKMNQNRSLFGELAKRLRENSNNLSESMAPRESQNYEEKNTVPKKSQNYEEENSKKSKDNDANSLSDFEKQMLSILESQNSILTNMKDDFKNMLQVSSEFYSQELKKNSNENKEQATDEKEDDKEHSENQKQFSQMNSMLSNVFSFFQRDRQEQKIKEEENATKNKSETPSEKSTDSAKTQSSNSYFDGVGGFLTSMLKGISTVFLGKGFTNFVSGILPNVLGKGSFLPIMRTLTAALIGPEFVSSLIKGLDSEDVASGITTFLDEFFAKGDVFSNLLKGAAAGLTVGGPKGAIAGALIAGAWSGLTNIMDGMGMSEKDQTSIKNNITGFLFGPAGGTMAGAALGFKSFGLPGAFIGAAIMSVGGLVGKAITNYKNQEGDDKSIGDAIKKTILENPLLTVMAGSTLGGTIGLAAGGPAGAIAGFLIGAGVSSAAILISDVIKNYESQPEGKKSIGSAMGKTLLNHPKLAMATTGAMGGALVGLMAGGPVAMIAGILIGGTVGLLAGMLAEFLEEIGVGRKIRNMLGRVKKAYDLIEDSIFNIDEAYEVLSGKQAVDKGQIGEMVDAGESDNAIRSLMRNSAKFDEKNIEDYDKKNESYEKARDVVTSLGDADYVKAFMEYLDTTKITRRQAIEDPSLVQNFQFKREGNDFKNGLYAVEQANLRQYLSLSADLAKREAELQFIQNDVLSRLGAKDFNIENATGEELKTVLYGIIDTMAQNQKAPTTTAPIGFAKPQATGGYYDSPQLIFVGENEKTNPEILFNRQQLQALGSIFNMQKENDTMKSVPMMPMMPPMPQPNIVDNKKITVQEQFNITEVLPAPSSHISFKDNILR